MIAESKELDEKVQEEAMSFPGEVVGIRYSIGNDWSGDPAIYFRVLLTDDASRLDVLGDVTGRISERLFKRFGMADLIPYFNFRSQSEQDKLQDPAWP